MQPRYAIAALCAVVACPAQATPLPEPIRAMVANALDTNDPEVIAAVVGIAAKTAPDSIDELDAMVSTGDVQPPPEPAVAPPPLAPQAPPATVAAIIPPPPPLPPPSWKGQVEVGGGQSTGSSDSLGVYGAIDLSRIEGDWTQKVTARADYQERDGEPTTERIAAAYQPQLKLDPVFYAYGLAQYEHDRFLGYQSRYTAGVGIGVSGVERPDLKISFDAGPAFRHTEFYELKTENAVAGRGAVSVKWAPAPRVTIAQDMAIYLERANTTARSTTALDTRLFGPLKARLSYNIQYERDAPNGQKSVDTTSRASLVYSF